MNDRQPSVPLIALTRAICVVVTALMFAAIVYVGFAAYSNYAQIGV